ncbi:hypothetical protein [Nannocystis radixulma]|uniref:Carboxypeptidase regulatory-like domain-containing protein n=1 Tax=Nannocystis radixulma TaxID=2995305 RepID=A0ABT5BFD6_9BACT|nr:hypothetical protein [Nannocystis radixulma]MDC0672792.1 hypothetical protein [Nannocystis radixulma]
MARALAAVFVVGCTSTQPPPAPAPALAQEPAPTLGPERISCGIDRPGPPVGVSQGIAGAVCFWQGDFMPGDPEGTIRPVARTIEIHAVTRREEAKPSSTAAFWDSVSTPLVATASSGADGWFEVALPPGSYSLFVREPQGLFANGYDEAGIIASVEVVAGKVTRKQLDVDYAAAH